MHFYYIDESGCTGRDLINQEQRIFVSGGVIIRDEGWNQTNLNFWNIISDYFDARVPDDFELHACDLLSPAGEGLFLGQDRERRNTLARNLLNLISDRSHGIIYFAIDKSRLNQYDISHIQGKEYFDLKTPYLVAYDYLISIYEWYTKERLGRSARALVILDEKEIFANEISAITQFRRYTAPNRQKVKRLTEFSYAVDSRKNPMIQLSDLICFLTKKFLEIESGYRENYSPEVKNIFRDFYKTINSRVIRKTMLDEPLKQALSYNQFISSISVSPRRNWRTIEY